MRKVVFITLLVAGLLCASSFMAVGANATAMPSAMNPPVVRVEGGLLRGYVEDSTYAFVGIQYAKAERFGMPEKVEPWEGVKDAQVYGPICPMAPMNSVSNDEFVWPHRYWPQNETCQYLNIWTQTLDTSAKKPVMVFLHGGAFSNGSSIEAVAYEGKNLSEFGDVVVVTLNHRLNILGTLDLSAYGEEYKYSAHTGMADIVAALEWVQENIAYFGGDPGNVTIFGQSGGSGKVVNLMQIPAAKGLFHKAIAQSSGTATVNSKEEALRITELTLRFLGLNGDQIDELINVPYEELLAAGSRALATASEEFGRNISWRPVCDDEWLMSDFCEWADYIPFIAGTTFSERNSTLVAGDGRKNEWTSEEIDANLRARFGENTDEIIAEFTRLFPNKKVQDAYFYAPDYRARVRQGLANKLENAKAPVYNYLFAFEAPVNGGITPFHCAELIYVFHNVGMRELRRATGATPEAFKVQDVVAQAWVNFAYTGDPSQEGLEWRPYSETGNGTMVFDIESTFTILDDQKMVELMLSM
jgi:para-nitrobenzyl esterase